MNLVTRARFGWSKLVAATKAFGLQSVSDSRGWTVMRDWGNDPSWFQRDIVVNHGAVLANWTIFSCITLISSDIGKVALRLVEQRGRIWVESAGSAAFSPVLRKPNGYQTRQQFIESWMVSKLTRGNTYVLLGRDQRGVVNAMYVLDPSRVSVLVAESGEVFYQLSDDNLAGVTEHQMAVPASEIIHDRFNCLFHPLVGLSPIFASGLAAMQGLHIQQNSAKFFRNMSQPGGVLTAPAKISDEAAGRIKQYWEKEFSGEKVGRVAVLGDGLKYESMGVSPVDAQMAEQMKATAEMICSTFHVPAFKIGAGTIPAGQKVEDLNQIYYADSLHALMDAIQTLLVQGLGLDTSKEGKTYGVQFDLDDLLKMDSSTLTSVLRDQVGAGIVTPNEARERLNYSAVKGGSTPYLQVQNYSLAALDKRDSQADPFAPATPPAAPTPAPAERPSEPAPPKELLELTTRAAAADGVLRELLDEVRILKSASDAESARRDASDQVRAVTEQAGRDAEQQMRDLCAALQARAAEAINAP